MERNIKRLRIKIDDYYSELINQIDIDVEKILLAKYTNQTSHNQNGKKRLNQIRKNLIDEITKSKIINLNNLNQNANDDPKELFKDQYCIYFKKNKNSKLGKLICFDFYVPNEIFKTRLNSRSRNFDFKVSFLF